MQAIEMWQEGCGLLQGTYNIIKYERYHSTSNLLKVILQIFFDASNWIEH